MKNTGYEKSFFEDWSKDYDERRNKSFLEKSKERMRVLVENYADSKLQFLEMGLGTGEVFDLTSQRFANSYGTDISEGMVRKTYSKGTIKKKLFVSDVCNLPIKSDSIDFVICQDVLEHVPYQEKLILEICRVLRKKGIGIITTPNPLWASALYVAEKLGLKVEEGKHKFVFLKGIVQKSLINSDCSIVSNESFMMIPIQSKLDNFFESLSTNEFFSYLGFSQMCVIRKN